MQLKQLFTDDQGVSPVIGVILMVAITVILAAVIGTFVLGLGGNLSQNAPSATFQFDYSADDGTNNGSLTISHAGGDTITSTNLHIKTSEKYNDNDGSPSSKTSETWDTLADSGDGEASAGDTVTISETDSGDDKTQFADLTARVVWQSAEGDASATLGRWDGPDA